VVAQTVAPPVTVEVLSPAPASVIGGLVAIYGTVQAALPGEYSLAFAPSQDASHWISILEPSGGAAQAERLALWDTTRIPDGEYALRLRLTTVDAQGAKTYHDAFVSGLIVSNAPRTPTPYPTAAPTHTPTVTPTPSATPTVPPTPALAGGESPYLYLTLSTSHDPLCPGWQQRFSIWVTNVGAITVTNITVAASLPGDTRAILSQSTEGAAAQGVGYISWEVSDLRPGEGAKLELQMEVDDWAREGVPLPLQVSVSSDQVSDLARSISFVQDECPWLEATLSALPLPTDAPTRTPTLTPTPGAGDRASSPQQTLVWPTGTPLQVSIPEEAVDRSLDVLTGIIIAILAALAIGMGIMLYRRLGRRW